MVGVVQVWCELRRYLVVVGAPTLDSRLWSVHGFNEDRLRCERVGDDTSGYRYNLLLSNRSIVPIDRMNTWGPRKPDSIHAYFTAQLAVVELMLNHLCLQTPGPEVTPPTDVSHLEQRL